MKKNDYTALLQPVGTKQETTLEEVAEPISQKIRFQMDIISDDFENGVQTSMKVFYKVLEDLLYYAEKEEAFKQEQDKKMYSELIDLLERLTTIYKEDCDLDIKYNKKRLEFIEQFKKK